MHIFRSYLSLDAQIFPAAGIIYPPDLDPSCSIRSLDLLDIDRQLLELMQLINCIDRIYCSSYN